MKFSAEILIYTLSGTTTFYTNIAFHEFLPLDYIEIWENGLPAKDTLYLVRAGQIMQDPSIWRGRVVFCSGRVDPETAEQYGIHLISVSDRMVLKDADMIAGRAESPLFSKYTPPLIRTPERKVGITERAMGYTVGNAE